MTQGEAIRGARSEARMTQEHLAKAAGVSEKTVRRAERDERISEENLRALCSVIGLNAVHLAIPGGSLSSTTAHPPSTRPSIAGMHIDVPASPVSVERDDRDPRHQGAPDGLQATHVPLTPPDRTRAAKYAMLAVSVLVVSILTTYGAYRDAHAKWEYEAATLATVKNPDFVRAAAREGYRIEIGRNFITKWVVARCMRANSDGPLPCGTVNRPEGRIGDAMEFVPPEISLVSAAPGEARNTQR